MSPTIIGVCGYKVAYAYVNVMPQGQGYVFVFLAGDWLQIFSSGVRIVL